MKAPYKMVIGGCYNDGPFVTMGHVTYPSLNVTLDFVNTRNEKSRKKISRTAKFEVCSIQI